MTGFSILPPSGPNWCAVFHPGGIGIAFIKNNYAGELLIPPPPVQRRKHTLVVVAMLVHSNRDPFTIGQISQEFADCIPARLCQPDALQLGRVEINGAQCVVATVNAVVRRTAAIERHSTCIHPMDPHFVVRLIAVENFQAGQPYYRPPLIEAYRPELDVFFRSLTFSPIEPGVRHG